MRDKFEQNLQALLPDYLNHRFVVAVSGGVDSVVLAELMLSLVPRDQLVVAHFDHRTRGEESDEDRRFVERFARLKNVALELGERRGEKLSEDRLRKERHEFLRSVRLKHQCDFVLLAHHLQDQLETFLMRLLRGTGLDGLAVMEPKRGFWVRPLLGFSKESLEKEAEFRGIHYRTDSSNLNPQYLRNRIRLNLMPNLEELSSQYGGKEKWLQRLEPLFEEIRWTRKDLNQRAKRKIQKVWTETPFWIRLPTESLEEMKPQEKSRAFRVILSRLGVDSLSMIELKRLERAVSGGQRSICSPGILVKQSCGYMYFQKRGVNNPTLEFKFLDKKNGHVICDALGLSIRSEYDPDQIEWRHYKPGDRFGGKKVKEYFLQKRIPRPERELIPVLALKNSKELIWVFPETDPKVKIEELSFPFVVNQRLD